MTKAGEGVSFWKRCALLFVLCFFASVTPSAFADMTAIPVDYTLSVNEQNYKLSVYSIDGEVYFKWRDVAAVLNKSLVQFQVEWDETERAARVIKDRPYIKVGGELEKLESAATAVLQAPTMYINGNRSLEAAYLIGGNTYQRLDVIVRDIDVSTEGLMVSVDMGSSTASISGVRTQDYVGADEFTLTLRADKNEALLNGEACILPTRPFIDKDTFYVPLESVTKLLGGNYSFEGDTAKSELFGVTSEYCIGSQTMVRDGEIREFTGNRMP